jgi:hypothetical protein
MDKIIRKKLIKKMLVENISWGGLLFYEYDLEEYLNKKLSSMEEHSILSITPEVIKNCRLLWNSLPPEIKLTLQAGILLPVSSLSFSSVVKLPDLDIKLLGIGWHRYFLFHSAIGVWILQQFFDTYNEYLDNKEHPGSVKKIFGAIGAGASAAIGLHLLKDGAFGYFEGEKSVVFGFPGIFKRNTLIKGTYIDDNIWSLGF